MGHTKETWYPFIWIPITHTWLKWLSQVINCIIIFFSLQELLFLYFVVLLPFFKKEMPCKFVSFFSWDTLLLILLAARNVHLRLGPCISLRLSQTFTHQASSVDYSFKTEKLKRLTKWTSHLSDKKCSYTKVSCFKVSALDPFVYLFWVSPSQSCFQHKWAWSPCLALRWWPEVLHICSEALGCQWSPSKQQEQDKQGSIFHTYNQWLQRFFFFATVS